MTTYEEPTAEVVEHLDRVDQILAEARQDLRDRQARGEIPQLAPGELERQFDAIVEADDADLEPTLDAQIGVATHLSGLPNWTPEATGLRGRLVSLGTAPARRFVGRLVRNQASPFSTQTADLIRRLADNQGRQARFLRGAHLDRIRSLEARIAQLELEITRLRHAEHDDAASPGGNAS